MVGSVAVLWALTAPAQAMDLDLGISKWEGEGELGFNSSTGNSTASNLNARLGLTYLWREWEHELKLTGIQAEKSGEKIKERYVLSGHFARSYADNLYGFGSVRYDRDLFSGYDYQATLAGGVGKRFWQQKGEVLNLETGLGMRADALQSGQERQEPIWHNALKLRYPVNPNWSLLQDLLVQAGEHNVHSESVSGIKVSMTEKVALKLTLTLKHNSRVDLDRKHLDTLTAVTLVYGF